MMEAKVQKRLCEHAGHVDEWCAQHGYVRIVTYLIGSWNYGLGEEGSDVDSRSLVVPMRTTEILKEPIEAVTIFMDNEEQCSILDARFAIQTYYKQCITALEGLFSPYVDINPDYAHFFNFLVANREYISKIDGTRFLKAQIGYMYSMFTKKQLSGKNVMHMARVQFLLTDLVNGYFVTDALNAIDHKEILLGIKHSPEEEYLLTAMEIKKWADEAKDKLKSFFELKYQLCDYDIQALKDNIDKALVDLYSSVWNN